MKFEILIGSDNFWNSLQADMMSADKKICIQAMTFEADSVGLKAFEALKQASCPEKFLCVDNFSNLVISDDFIYGRRRLWDAAFRREVRDTKSIFKHAPDHNISLFFTNPMGAFFYKYPHRNHKKLMLIDDDIAYVGGINFSEHNFEWHDIMVRINDPEIAAILSDDFEHTTRGKNQSKHVRSGDTDLFILDGHRSHALYEDLFAVLASAKKSIRVISPYITWPFLDVIGERANASVDVQIISPQANNKKLLKYYLQYQQQKYPLSVYMYEKKMSHLKAILIDDEILMMGSTNFDFVSYCLEQEYCLVLRDKKLIASFKEKVVDDALNHSQLFEEPKPTLRHSLSYGVISLAIFLVNGLARIIYRSTK